ncbi:MAG: hypothetical protein E6H86_12835 [Chloroflexi bacterium]|nr:MAG: hypothetical protein E6H86_12835 [Chloroflexota bacterium]
MSSSAAFSAFSAVLAGLMFAGMVLLLTRELREYRASSPTTGLHRPIGGQFASWVDPFMARPVAFMLGSLFCLIVAAFLYAAMAGDYQDPNNPDVKQFVEGAMPSLALSLGVVQLAVSLAWLVQVRALAGLPPTLAHRIVDASVVIASVFMTGVVISPLFQIPQIRATVPGQRWLWLGLACALLVSIPLGWMGRRVFDDQAEDRLAQVGFGTKLATDRDQVIRVVTVASVVVSTLAAIAWNVITSFDASDLNGLYTFPGYWLLVLLAAVAIGMFSGLEAAMPSAESKRTR